MAKVDKRPVTVVSGFLGSGKTTLLRKLLAGGGLGHVAVVINEFGEVGLDYELVRSVSEQTVLVGGGCACCERREDLVRSLRELLDLEQQGTIPRLDRVLVETTGLADPAPVLFTIATDPVLQHHFHVEGVLVTVDALNARKQLDAHVESGKQVAVADRIVLTKVDLADPVAVRQLEADLRERNPTAELARTGLEAPAGPGLVEFQDSAVRAIPERVTADHGGSVATSLTFDRPLDWVAFSVWLSMLLHVRGEQVLRVKGLLDVGGEGPVSVNGVQHVIHPPEHLPRWPEDGRASRLVLITQELDPGEVERSLLAFQPVVEQ